PFFRDVARLGAGAAQPDLAAVADELCEQILEGGKAGRGDVVGPVLGTEPDGVDRAEYDRVLPGCGGDVGRDERKRRALGGVLAIRAVEDQFVAHRPRSTVIVRAPSGSASTE